MGIEWKVPDNLETANMAIIDLTATDINRRLDMIRPSDLAFVVELIRQGTANRVPIVVRICAGDIQNDLTAIEKSGADGVILSSLQIPIEAVISSARAYGKEMTVLVSCKELNADSATKMIALGCSGIFLEKECTNKELNDFASELAGKVGSLGVGKISDLSPENLRTSNQETAAMTGVPLAGYDSILPMWRH